MKLIPIKSILFSLLVVGLSSGYSQNTFAQCNFITPPKIKKVNYANREVTFSGVTMNGKATTYLAVKKGETVKIKTYLSSRKKGSYCPDCIVQVYWGIRDYVSTCAKSFYGYQFSKKQSKLKFKAPEKDGIYYVTMGGSLEYSCKNNKLRPNCAASDAFAVIKVGNPDPEKIVSLNKVSRGAATFLKTTLVKAGCFGDLDKVEWFLDDKKLAYDNKKEIPLTKLGTYKAVWSSCLTEASKTYVHQKETPKAIQLTVVKTEQPSTQNGTAMADLVENKDKFVLENLIFDLGKSSLNPAAKKDLNELANIMKEKPNMRILLEGHTDKRGNARKNQVLSEERVEAAKAYLVEQGVNKRNIETKGWGHQKPLIITSDVEEGSINRRVEIQILSR